MEPVHSPFWHRVICIMRSDPVDVIEQVALACAGALLLTMSIGVLVAWQSGLI